MAIFHSRKPMQERPKRWTLSEVKVAGKPQSVGWPKRWNLEPASNNAREERMKKK